MKTNDKKMRNVTLLACLAFLIIATLGVFVFCRSQLKPSDGLNVYVFDGWVYGREDQKKACAALATAGLSDYTWESGRLSVPSCSKNAYQSVLSNAGAYPKAPSEMRGEALRQMSPFESDSKTKMRELDACALQLERMIEQMRGVEYATVGVRARKEVVGLSSKNIVTASVGVAAKDDFELDSNALTAITITTQRLLGIEDSKNVAILDLKEGKSYLGCDNVKERCDDLALVSEREWTEKYWRNKYLEAFSDVENIRVTVDVDLVRTTEKAALNNVGSATEAGTTGNSHFLVKERDPALPVPCDNVDKEERIRNSHDDASFSNSHVFPCGFAQLGNPNASRSQNARKKQSSIWAIGEGLGKDDTKDPFSFGSLCDLLNCVSITTSQSCLSLALNDSCDYSAQTEKTPSLFMATPRLIEVSVNSSETIPHIVPLDNESVYCSSGEVGIIPSNPVVSGRIRQTNFLEEKPVEGDSTSHNDLFELRSILVHIWLPRTYVSRAVSRYLGQETFADSSESVREMLERQMLEETKRDAISIFRPTSERLGWTDEILANSFIIDVYSDAGLPEDNSELSSQEVRTSAKFGSFSLPDSIYSFEENGSEIEDDSADQSWSAATEDREDSVENKDSIKTNVDNNRYGVIASTSGKVADLSTSVTDSENGFQYVENEYVAQLKSFADMILDVDWQEQKQVLTISAACIVGFAFLVGIARIALFRRRQIINGGGRIKSKKYAKVENRGRESRKSVSYKTRDHNSFLSELDNESYDDELDAELERLGFESKRENKSGTPNNSVDHKNELEEFSDKRRKALELISRYPERAAASLQGWVKGSSL